MKREPCLDDEFYFFYLCSFQKMLTLNKNCKYDYQ